MTTLSLTRARSARTTAVGVVGFAAALAAASQVAVPIPGTAVPFTLQPFVVLLAGLWLGPAAGAASMMLYIAAGVAGLPVWSPFGAPGAARLLGPTGGYILAWPVAAFLTGWVARRVPSLAGRIGAAVLGMLVILAGGLAQLTALTGSASAAMAAGVHPFLALDFVKAVAAALAPPRRGGRASA